MFSDPLNIWVDKHHGFHLHHSDIWYLIIKNHHGKTLGMSQQLASGKRLAMENHQFHIQDRSDYKWTIFIHFPQQGGAPPPAINGL